jgi:hypothetical protein
MLPQFFDLDLPCAASANADAAAFARPPLPLLFDCCVMEMESPSDLIAGVMDMLDDSLADFHRLDAQLS